MKETWDKIRELAKMASELEDFLVNNLGDEDTEGELTAEQEETLTLIGRDLDTLGSRINHLVHLEGVK